jgi:hypothetical protein
MGKDTEGRTLAMALERCCSEVGYVNRWTHSWCPWTTLFLRYKKAPAEYGFRVEKISIKEQTVTVQREA